MRTHFTACHGPNILDPVGEAGDLVNFSVYLDFKKKAAIRETELRKEERADMAERRKEAAVAAGTKKRAEAARAKKRAEERHLDGEDTDSA